MDCRRAKLKLHLNLSWKNTKVANARLFTIKEVIGQTQTDRKELSSSVTKWWSDAEGKEKRDVINEIRLNEDSRRVQKVAQQPQQGLDLHDLCLLIPRAT